MNVGQRFQFTETNEVGVIIGILDEHWWYRMEGTVIPVFKGNDEDFIVLLVNEDGA